MSETISDIEKKIAEIKHNRCKNKNRRCSKRCNRV